MSKIDDSKKKNRQFMWKKVNGSREKKKKDIELQSILFFLI